MSGPNVDGLNEHQRRFLLATPRQQPADAGWIAWRAGGYTGNQFASFARGNKAWFQRIAKYGQGGSWTYRLSPEGADAASAIEAATAAETPQDGSVHESATAKPGRPMTIVAQLARDSAE